MVVEKNIDLVLDGELAISYAFNRMGFKDVAIIEGPYYPALVLAFYTDAMYKRKEDTIIETIVEGHAIKVTQ